MIRIFNEECEIFNDGIIYPRMSVELIQRKNCFVSDRIKNIGILCDDFEKFIKDRFEKFLTLDRHDIGKYSLELTVNWSTAGDLSVNGGRALLSFEFELRSEDFLKMSKEEIVLVEKILKAKIQSSMYAINENLWSVDNFIIGHKEVIGLNPEIKYFSDSFFVFQGKKVPLLHLDLNKFIMENEKGPDYIWMNNNCYPLINGGSLDLGTYNLYGTPEILANITKHPRCFIEGSDWGNSSFIKIADSIFNIRIETTIDGREKDMLIIKVVMDSTSAISDLGHKCMELLAGFIETQLIRFKETLISLHACRTGKISSILYFKFEDQGVCLLKEESRKRLYLMKKEDEKRLVKIKEQRFEKDTQRNQFRIVCVMLVTPFITALLQPGAMESLLSSIGIALEAVSEFMLCT